MPSSATHRSVVIESEPAKDLLDLGRLPHLLGEKRSIVQGIGQERPDRAMAAVERQRPLERLGCSRIHSLEWLDELFGLRPERLARLTVSSVETLEGAQA